jgi:hypothetical protein
MFKRPRKELLGAQGSAQASRHHPSDGVRRRDLPEPPLRVATTVPSASPALPPGLHHLLPLQQVRQCAERSRRVTTSVARSMISPGASPLACSRVPLPPQEQRDRGKQRNARDDAPHPMNLSTGSGRITSLRLCQRHAGRGLLCVLPLAVCDLRPCQPTSGLLRLLSCLLLAAVPAVLHIVLIDALCVMSPASGPRPYVPASNA